MASGNKDREARDARERARVYRARQELHAGQTRRRVRDNVIAGIVGGVIVVGAIGSQVVYFTTGPGTPPPSATPSPSQTGGQTPAPTDSLPPTSVPTPAPTP